MTSRPVVQVSKVGVLQFWKSIPSVAIINTPTFVGKKPLTILKNRPPSKHLLVFKTSWRLLQRVFTITVLRLRRRLEDVLKTSSRPLTNCFEDVFKLSWKTKNCYTEGVFKTSSRHVLKKSWRHVLKTSWGHILKTSSRRLGGKQKVYWWYLYLTNLNVYLTNLCFTNLYLTNLRRIQNALLRTQ